MDAVNPRQRECWSVCTNQLFGRVEINGLDMATVKGKDAKELHNKIQMIFQDPYASLNPRWSVGRIIAEPIIAQKVLTDKKEIQDRIDSVLWLVNMSPEDKSRYPHQFSGGQRQRISIARSIAIHPEFIVCDEPTSALDVSVQAQVLNLMQNLQKEIGLTYLFISHNLSVVHHISDRVGVMYLGRLVELADKRFCLTILCIRIPNFYWMRFRILEASASLERKSKERCPILLSRLQDAHSIRDVLMRKTSAERSSLR